jgi:hypothetical protein
MSQRLVSPRIKNISKFKGSNQDQNCETAEIINAKNGQIDETKVTQLSLEETINKDKDLLIKEDGDKKIGIDQKHRVSPALAGHNASQHSVGSKFNDAAHDAIFNNIGAGH